MLYRSTVVFEKSSRMTWFYLRHLYPLRNPQSSLRALSAEHMVWTGFYLLEEKPHMKYVIRFSHVIL